MEFVQPNLTSDLIMQLPKHHAILRIKSSIEHVIKRTIDCTGGSSLSVEGGEFALSRLISHNIPEKET